MLAPLASVIVTGLVVLFVVHGPTTADQPLARSDIPAAAFEPVTLPSETTPPGETTLPSETTPPRETAAPGTPPRPDVAFLGRSAERGRLTSDPGRTPPAGPIHVVQAGDTLWQIAVWHRADLQLIIRWNEGIDPRGLVAGQRILVPGGGPMSKRPPAPLSTKATASQVASGDHLWPLPTRGTITTRFSAAHPGIDIAAPARTLVRAIAGGTVTWAGWKTNGGGFVVVIRHRDGMVSTYNHNRSVAVAVGQVVKAGQGIAAVGATGLATGPHLDLRVQMGGRSINPLSLY